MLFLPAYGRRNLWSIFPSPPVWTKVGFEDLSDQLQVQSRPRIWCWRTWQWRSSLSLNLPLPCALCCCRSHCSQSAIQEALLGQKEKKKKKCFRNCFDFLLWISQLRIVLLIHHEYITFNSCVETKNQIPLKIKEEKMDKDSPISEWQW